MDIQFLGNVFIEGEIKAETGIHIGGSKAIVEIGGIDNIVIKDPMTGYPIIPGSSLKGKLRSLLEIKLKEYEEDGSPHSHKKECTNENCVICRIFGTAKHAKNIGPTRILIRDAFLSHFELEGEDGKERSNLERLRDLIYEVKTENYINRLQAKAESPRHFERVAAGAVFRFSMVFGIHDKSDVSFLRHVIEAMQLLEDSYLGGHGSRGYGKVRFKNITISLRSSKDYEEARDKRVIQGEHPTLKHLHEGIQRVIDEIDKKLSEQ